MLALCHPSHQSEKKTKLGREKKKCKNRLYNVHIIGVNESTYCALFVDEMFVFNLQMYRLMTLNYKSGLRAERCRCPVSITSENSYKMTAYNYIL